MLYYESSQVFRETGYKNQYWNKIIIIKTWYAYILKCNYSYGFCLLDVGSWNENESKFGHLAIETKYKFYFIKDFYIAKDELYPLHIRLI